MKKIFLNILVLSGLAILFSCKKDLQTYKAPAAIYFNETARLPKFTGEVITDSTVFSFSLYKYPEVVFDMVVATTGAPSNVDRKYELSVNPNSNAIEGVHYQILNQDFTIKKNKLKDTVQIKFFRTADMASTDILLSFDLKSNANFSTSMNYKTLANGNKYSYINYRWLVNDILKKPARWLDAYLGTFSKKKMLLMVEILGVDPAHIDKTVSIGELAAYGKFMQRYFNEQAAAGNIIYEADDTTIMEMGPASK